MAGLEDLYREIILDHYRSPKKPRRACRALSAHRVEGFNPLCGDEIVVYLDVDDDVLRDVRISGTAVPSASPLASMMSAAVKEQVREGGSRPRPLCSSR